MLLRFCFLNSSLASSFSSSSVLNFLFASFLHSRCASMAFVLLSYICFFFQLFGAWLTLLGFFPSCSPLFFGFFYCMLAFMFCASLLYFLDDYHNQKHIIVLLANAEIREGRCILSYRDCCFPCLSHGVDAFLSDWYRILPILNWQFLEVNYEINYLSGVNLLSMFSIS